MVVKDNNLHKTNKQKLECRDEWFDIKCKKKEKITPEIKVVDTTEWHVDIFRIYPSKEQCKILLRWLDEAIEIYNATNQFIKNDIQRYKIESKDEELIKYKPPSKYYLRDFIMNPIIESIQNRTANEKQRIGKHVADYEVFDCLTSYKVAYSNLKHYRFNVKNREFSRRKKEISIEPAAVSKKYNTLFPEALGKRDIKSGIPLNIIRKNDTNGVLYYDSRTNKFFVRAPLEIFGKAEVKKYNKCGVDPGIRTFLTTYSTESCYEIGTNTNVRIDKLHKKIDKIEDNFKLSTLKKSRTREKYQSKLTNLVNDLHQKSASFLVQKYDIILLGKLMVSGTVSKRNKDGTYRKRKLSKKNCRRILALSHCKFRTRIQSMAKRFGTKVEFVDEFQTSMRCSSCHNKKLDLGANKIYQCTKCKLRIDRDLNSAKNMYDQTNFREMEKN